MSGLYPVLKAERKVLRKLLQLLQIPPHFDDEVVEFGLEILLHAVAEELRKPAEHRQRIPLRKPDPLEVFDPRDELLLDAGGEEVGVFVDLGDSDALEEVERGAEPVLDAAGEQSRPSVDHAAQIGAVDAGLPDQEGEDRDDVGNPRRQDLRAHSDNAAELDGREPDGGDEIDGGFDVGEREGEDRRVVVD